MSIHHDAPVVRRSSLPFSLLLLWRMKGPRFLLFYKDLCFMEILSRSVIVIVHILCLPCPLSATPILFLPPIMSIAIVATLKEPPSRFHYMFPFLPWRLGLLLTWIWYDLVQQDHRKPEAHAESGPCLSLVCSFVGLLQGPSTWPCRSLLQISPFKTSVLGSNIFPFKYQN